jgi:hypothetical protein
MVKAFQHDRSGQSHVDFVRWDVAQINPPSYGARAEYFLARSRIGIRPSQKIKVTDQPLVVPFHMNGKPRRAAVHRVTDFSVERCPRAAHVGGSQKI